MVALRGTIAAPFTTKGCFPILGRQSVIAPVWNLWGGAAINALCLRHCVRGGHCVVMLFTSLSRLLYPVGERIFQAYLDIVG